MITLYHCISARSFRALWMLEELGVPYALKMLPFPPRVLARDFLELNPRGTVPLMIDGDTRMTESAAICEYLATRFSCGAMSVESHEANFGAYLNYLHLGEATLTFPQTLVLRYSHFEPPERLQPQVVEDYSKWFVARLRTLEPTLEREDFLCARRFTAADVSVGYALLLAEYLRLNERFTPGVARYWQRLRARDGFMRAMAAQEQAAIAQGVSTVPAAAVP